MTIVMAGACIEATASQDYLLKRFTNAMENLSLHILQNKFLSLAMH